MTSHEATQFSSIAIEEDDIRCLEDKRRIQRFNKRKSVEKQEKSKRKSCENPETVKEKKCLKMIPETKDSSTSTADDKTDSNSHFLFLHVPENAPAISLIIPAKEKTNYKQEVFHLAPGIHRLTNFKNDILVDTITSSQSLMQLANNIMRSSFDILRETVEHSKRYPSQTPQEEINRLILRIWDLENGLNH